MILLQRQQIAPAITLVDMDGMQVFQGAGNHEIGVAEVMDEIF